MKIHINQAQKQTQTFFFTPQLKQFIKVLQAPALELRKTVINELQNNPVLEELPYKDISIEEKFDNLTTVKLDLLDNSNIMELGYDQKKNLEQINQKWKRYSVNKKEEKLYNSKINQTHEYALNSLVNKQSLQDYLFDQARILDSSFQENQALKYLIGSLDNQGLLTTPLKEIAKFTCLPLAKIQKAAILLRSFDPPGIGSPNLKTCLIQQLKLKKRGNSLAAKILKKHFKFVLHKRISDLIRLMGVNAQSIQKAFDEISKLDLAPGRRFDEDVNQVIIPDLYIRKINNNWIAQLSSQHIPKLYLNRTYKNMIAEGKIINTAKIYIQHKLNEGKFLIEAIEKRQNTIKRIAQCLIKYQINFFEKGMEYLNGLTMNIIAKKIGMHETTISRAITNKYVHTPHGTFALRHFFTTGVKINQKQTISNTSLKYQIQRIIKKENPKNPLSDQVILEIFKKKNILISRRTITKYRKELNITSTYLRRRY